MMYWIILIVLSVLIFVTIMATVATILKERKEYRKFDPNELYGAQEDYGDDYEDMRLAPKGRKSGMGQAFSGDGEGYAKNLNGNKRRWKIILEDVDTKERHTYIFYDSLGIGRTTKEVAFEKFLSLPSDRKVSKVHCGIICGKDKLFLKDEGSKNHTYLNGKKIQKPIVIQKEDFISLGETELEVIHILRETN